MNRIVPGILILLWSCGTLNPQQAATEPFSHSDFTELLKEHVDDEGLVDYEEINDDREDLKEYLNQLSTNAPNDNSWSEEEQLAYWINAYNAFTIELILKYYPIKSIRDIGSTIQIPFINTPWDIKFIEIAGEKYSLNNIEHNIIRKKWKEPRIHFALNCASLSCPRLRTEGYEASKLNSQLDEQARAFINNEELNKITTEKAMVSELFDTYEGDFTQGQSIREFINQYAENPIGENTQIEYLEYDWSLNVQD